MSVNVESVRADALSRVFLWAGGPATTATLAGAFLVLASVGLFLPQEMTAEALAKTMPAGDAHIVVGLGLHHVLRGWPAQLVLILLTLNLSASVLRRLFAPDATAEAPSRAGVARAEVVQGPAAPVRLEDGLRAVLPGWAVRRLGEGHAVARKGLTFEGLAVVGLGLLVLGAAYLVAVTTGTRGFVHLMVGEPADPAVHARYKVQREEGDSLYTWTPVPRFELMCGPVAGGALAGERTCWVDTEKGRSKTTLRPGDDLEFEGFRLTLIGVTRLPGAGPFELDVDARGQRTSYVVTSGDAVDVERGGKRIATLMISGDTAQDPVGVIPAEKEPPPSDLRVSARPRPQLTFRLTTEEHVPWIWAGATLVLIGLGLALGLPGYRLVAERGANGQVALVVTGTGILARPEHEMARITRALSAGTSRPS